MSPKMVSSVSPLSRIVSANSLQQQDGILDVTLLRLAPPPFLQKDPKGNIYCPKNGRHIIVANRLMLLPRALCNRKFKIRVWILSPEVLEHTVKHGLLDIPVLTASDNFAHSPLLGREAGDQ